MLSHCCLLFKQEVSSYCVMYRPMSYTCILTYIRDCEVCISFILDVDVFPGHTRLLRLQQKK